MKRMLLLMGVTAVVTLAGCGNHGTAVKAPDQASQSALKFVQFPPGLLAQIPQEDSMYAVVGQDRKLVLRYAPTDSESEGEEFLSFDVPGDALLKRPDGSSFAPGDSILIHVRLDPQGRFLFEFDPAGLTFSGQHPATLQVNYHRTGGDLNGDGEVDAADSVLKQELGVWKQENAGEPWIKINSTNEQEADQIVAKIYGFTGFCVAGL